MKIYLVTESNGRNPHTHTSLSDAKRSGEAAVYTRGPDGDYYGYSDRSDMARDARGDAPHLVTSIVRPIDPTVFLADEDQPSAWLSAVRAAVR